MLRSTLETRCQLTQFTAASCINSVQKHRRVLWAQAPFRWTKRQWKGFLWSEEFKFSACFHCAKNEKDHPDYFPWKVPNTCEETFDVELFTGNIESLENVLEMRFIISVFTFSIDLDYFIEICFQFDSKETFSACVGVKIIK